ncbi:hypothetical protein HBB16_05585 [Pseudonocardia sp. MCCB 268]|nr:hypothetical protein [Pseudonocardia cytotoxica]
MMPAVVHCAAVPGFDRRRPRREHRVARRPRRCPGEGTGRIGSRRTADRRHGVRARRRLRDRHRRRVRAVALGVTERLSPPARTAAASRAGYRVGIGPISRTWRFALRAGRHLPERRAASPATPSRRRSNPAGGVEAPPRAVRGIGSLRPRDGATAVRVTTTAPDLILPLRLSSANTAIFAPSAYASDPLAVQGTGTDR